ncbi:4-(cytidine 5'-diphospho)-2-C-methyl-D-erythritol kinase [Stappia indica]|uniref:4-diphosphocytidyl-2-C-methyl-D-erythritol kinase n=1 Tax=Stappia indica TaxID=538381 RepID=A0A285TR41_9HYPH|nr:4-(cytidine 5'-diphospho)-2-C-methyl-D-erythritol kinase [Stappia indica]SOC26018.1 4-diphosphocytidyl-2-C-methyl-D-erythritol kinase [Stappia indica]
MPAPLLARAKINYALHVTGRRADGYHLLQSLVAFAEFGDVLSAEPTAGADHALTLKGPFAGALAADTAGDNKTGDNLVLRALDALARAFGTALPPLALTLDKRLPVASGIGGGSADAAAALRLGFAAMAGREPGEDEMARLAEIAGTLGADVPMCLASTPALVSGTGTEVASLPRFPGHAILLANPGLPVATPEVFARLERRDNPPLSPLADSDLATFDALVGWLEGTRNDLETPALRLAPPIAEVLAALRVAPGARLARMSGSGATCFALFAGIEEAEREARRLTDRHPGWWIQAAPVAAVA